MTHGRLTVAIAGASGFVGKALLDALDQVDVVALGRHAPANERRPNVTWRACDLFSLLDAERGLAGVDVALYLVHSMMPSARMTQGAFEDLDLICADNFARAAERAGVKRILYLGGLLPSGAEAKDLSRHLRSRREVESTLAGRSLPVTTLRAGIVVGPGGSSCRMLVRLVERLPVMICPRWTRSRTQPIALKDVVDLLRHAIHDPETEGQTYDVGCPEVLTYAEMMRRTALLLGRPVRMLAVPWFTPHLSLLWVVAVTGYPASLVFPLVESARHDLVAHDAAKLRTMAGLTPTPFDDAMRETLAAERSGTLPSPRAERRARAKLPRPRNTVRSVQRLPLPPAWDAVAVATEYALWLPRFLRPLLRVVTDAALVTRFYLRPLPWPLLELTPAAPRSQPDRQLFYITGGLLAHVADAPRGRLEFRVVAGGRFVLAAIHDFVPTLPWLVYAITQARVHLWVMAGFGRHLRAMASRGAPPPPVRVSQVPPAKVARAEIA